MDRRRAAGALLALAAFFACATAAPTASNQTALDLYDADSAEGCYYNFQHYGEGDRIMTNEPCLNCTCHNRMLMCYLRVCPFTKPIGQDCTVEKRADQCCPIVTCPDVPVDLLTSTPTTSPAEYGTTGVGRLDKYGCSINGKYFSEGAKVPPSPNKPCEHCYCIRNMTTCVMQECTLHVDGCTPIYHKEVCCPIRYSCDHQDDEVPMLDDMTTTVRPTPGFLLTTTTMASVTQIPQECVHDDQIFPDGALIKTEKACEHCYCMKGDIVCVVQECGTPMENEGKNCTSLAPREGQCCPDTYICEGDEAPTELPTEAPTELPTEVPTESMTEAQKEAITEIPLDDVTKEEKEAATEVPKELTTKIPVEETTEVQKELVTEKPEEEELEGPKESATELPEQTTTEAAMEVTTQAATETFTKAAAEAASDAATEGSGEAASESASEAATESASETATEYATQAATDAATERVTEAATEIATEKATEAGTEAATQAASEATTEKASQASSDASSEEPTTFVPPRRTSVEGSGYRNEPDELFTESPFLEHETEGSGEEEGTEKPSDADVTSVPIEEATSSVSDEENEATTAKESSLYIPSSTEPPTAHTEQPTTEPDKGENTVPSDDTTLPSIFDVPSSEAPVTIKASEESSPAIEQKTEIPSEDKQGEQPSSTTQETYTSAFTESSIVTTEAQTATTEPALIVEDKEVTVTPAESVTSKQPENAIIDKQGETISPTTEKEELDIQTSIPFDEKESKSTTVQLPDVPAVAETVKPEEATTETVQEYTTSENKIKDQDMYTTAQPAIEELQTTTTSKLDIPETTSINPLENEIHEEGPAILTPGIIPGEGNCLIDGITYNNDSAIPTSHKCQSSCRCVSSIVKCEELMCSPPPENMGDCQAVYESEETCCPYYTCKPVKDTPPLKPHSQMSGTELPIIQGDCDGELCNKRDEATPTTSVSPQCTSGDCSSETDKVDTEECGAAGCSGEPIPVLTPTKEEDVIQPVVCSGGECSSPPKDCTGESCQLPTRKHCGKNEPCAVFPQETCEGPNCADTTPVKEPTEHVKENTPGCANPDDCKSSPDITKPSCEGEECTVIKQDCGSGKCENVPVEVTTTPDEQKEEACGVDGGCKKTDQSETPQPECTDETCIKKDVTVIEDKPSPVCTDESCVQKETTAPSSNIGPLSTELPELEDKPKTTVPGMETTEKRTELPETIETETERQTVSDAAVTEQVKIDTTAQPATEKQEVDTEMTETTSATHDNASQEPATEVISTKTPEITTETYRITELPESQEAEKTTAIPLTESQDSEASQTEPSVYGPTESPVTDKSQPETATTVPETEKEEPESIFTNAPLEVTSLETRIETTEPTVMDTTEPSKVDEEPSEPEVSESPEVPVTEKEEINTELPDALPTDSLKEPEDTEVTKLPEEAAVTESQEKEQSMAEEPAATERQPESPVTESQGDLITPDSKTPEQATEVPEADTDVKTEQPIKDELATKLPEVGTTSIPVSDEKDIITEAPKEPALESQERSTELPNVPIMDDKDNTESPEIGSSGITTAAPEKPASQDTSTETPELATTETHDINTKIPEMPMTEEQVKQTVIPEDLVTESQDIEPTSADQEHTTPSVYSVTESQAVTDGLREGAITEKELVPSEIPVTEVQEIVTSAPETTEENKTEQPTTEIEEVATETPEDKATLKPELSTSNVPEEQSVASELPVSPEQQTVSTVAPIASFPEDQEKQTEAPDANIPDSETKLPQFPSEPETSTDDSVTSVTETQEILTIAPEHSVQEDEKATESPATVSQATEKLDIPSEVPEVTTTEKEKAGTEIPEIVAPQEPEKQTEIPEILATESQEPAEVPSVQPTSEEEVRVTQPQDYVTEAPKIPEEEIKSTVEVQELTTQVPEEQHIEPAATKAPEVDDKQTTVKDEMKQTEFEEPTEEPEIGTKTPENLDFQTEAPLAHVTEPQESGTSPVEQQNVKQDEPESPVTQSQETVTESTELVKSEDDKITDIPEAPEKEPQDSLSTTIAPLSEQDRQTEGPIVIEKEDAITQLPEIVKTEEPQQQTEIPESPVTESQQTATKTPETDELDVKTVTTESPIETTQKEFSSGEPDISTDGPLKPEDQEVYTNAPESPVTESQISSSEPATEQDIPIVPVTQSEGISTGAPESTVQQDIDRQTMVPESHVTEPQQITTEAPKQEDISTETPASPITESQEAFTNVPVVLVPGEQPTEQPAIEAQKPATNVPEIPPVQEESQTESPVEQPQESVVPEQPDVPEKPVIPEEKVTESPETITTQGITTDAPVPPVTEKQDIPVTDSQDIATSVPDAATEEPIMQTLAPKLEYSETTPYLVELEEHTHKIEVETSTANPEDISVPQTTEVFEKPEETPTETEIEKQTEEPVTTEKSLEVSSIEPFTVAPTSSQEVVPTEAGLLDTKLGTDIDTSTPQEQSTPKSDVDDTKGTTLPEEVGEKVPETEQAVPMPILPVTEKEAEPTAQPEAETEKYTTAPPTDKPMEVTSSQEISSEEDFTPLRTTTVKSADETTTLAPSDKATTPEPKPTELPSPMSQETAKPTSSEEVPSEEDSGQFPPSGTGYGQEPDYAEEDQAFGPGTCRYGGKVYVSAQQIPRDDPCDFCFCFRSDIICLQQSCPPPIHGCHEEPIQGFCCPRYECPVSMATTLNMTTTTTTTTTTLPPHFLTHSYNGAAQKRGCLIKGNTYKVGEVVRASSGPCLHCTCGGDGQMKCDPKVCTPEPMLRQMIAAAVSAKRRR